MAERVGEYMEQAKEEKRQDAIRNSKHSRLRNFAYAFSDFAYFALGSDHNSRERARKETVKQNAFNEVRQIGIDERTIKSSSTIDDLPENIRPIVKGIVLKHCDNY